MTALSAQFHRWVPIILEILFALPSQTLFNLELPPSRFFEAQANAYVGYVDFEHFIPADERYLAVIEWLPTLPDLELQ
jgi:hypothetical protein